MKTRALMRIFVGWLAALCFSALQLPAQITDDSRIGWKNTDLTVNDIQINGNAVVDGTLNVDSLIVDITATGDIVTLGDSAAISAGALVINSSGDVSMDSGDVAIGGGNLDVTGTADFDSLVINSLLPFPKDSGETDQALVWTGGKIVWADVVSGDTIISGIDTVIIAQIVTELAHGEWSGQHFERIAGEKLFYGDAVFALPADNKVYKAKATSSDSMPAIGLVVTPPGDSTLADSTVQLLFSGAMCDTNLSLTATNLIYVDTATAGNLIGVPGMFGNVPGYNAVVIGTALDDTTFLLEIDLNVAVAGDSLYKRAIAGAGIFAEDSLYINGNNVLTVARDSAYEAAARIIPDTIAAHGLVDSATVAAIFTDSLAVGADSLRNKYFSVHDLGDSTVSGIVIYARAGEALTFGDLVFWKNDSLFLARGDTVGDTYYLPAAAMSADKTTAGGAVGSFLRSGYARASGWTDLPINGVVYVDTIAGGQMSRYAPTVDGMASQPVAVTVDSAAGIIDFSPTYVITVK